MDKMKEALGSLDVILGRMFISMIFIMSGFAKMFDSGGETIALMESAGVPGFLFWPAAIFEAGAGLAILFGIQLKLVSFLLIGFCMLTAMLFHRDFGDQMQMILFMKNLAMAGGLLFLMRLSGKDKAEDNGA